MARARHRAEYERIINDTNVTEHVTIMSVRERLIYLMLRIGLA